MIAGLANKQLCECVYSDLSKFALDNRGGGGGVDITPCAPNQEESRKMFLRKEKQRTFRVRDGDVGSGVSHARGREKEKKKPHCRKSPDCEVLLINGPLERVWLCLPGRQREKASQWDALQPPPGEDSR